MARVITKTKVFENFVSKIMPKLGKVTRLSAAYISERIQEAAFDPRLGTHGSVRGPAGQPVAKESLDEFGRATARALLAITPEVEYVTIFPRRKKALRFEWPDAPPVVRKKQKLFPVVFFAHVDAPVRVNEEETENRARLLADKSFRSRAFENYVIAQIEKLDFFT